MTSLPLILASCWMLGGATITTKDQIYIDCGTDKTLTDNITFVSAARSRLHCAVQCNQHDSCMTFTFHENTCTGYDDVCESSSSVSTPVTGARSFARENKIIRPEVAFSVDTKVVFFFAPTSSVFCTPSDGIKISTAASATWCPFGNARCERTGVKRLTDTSLGLDRDVYCDGDWLVFQRRIDGSVDFHRGWDDYVTGFGDPYGEYWLGLENLHRITTSGVNYELRVILTTFNGAIGTASYSNFSVGPAADNYTLNYDSFLGGNAGDSLLYHRGQQFSTFDADNDVDNYNCAGMCSGGWWYKKCYRANLNGDYKSTEMNDNKGIRWRKFNSYLTLKSCQMMIRPV